MAEPSKEVKVRPMAETDLPRVNEIDRMLFGDQRVPTWPFSFEVYWTVHKPQIKLVAEVSNRVVGFVVGTIVEEEHSQSVLNLRHSIGRPTQHRQVGWIDMIGVDIGTQGLGVGRTLVEAFAAECKRRGAAVKGIARENDVKLRRFLTNAGLKASNLVMYEKD
jgi:ribosomal protein S18 acetylase RimI-like enzyme